MKALLTLIVLLIVGCGTDSTPTKDVTTAAQTAPGSVTPTQDESKGDRGDVGPKGDTGVDGKDGVNGVNGVDGKDGIDGDNGKDGKDGLPVSENMWFDAITEHMWTFGIGRYPSECGSKYHMPTYDEAIAAQTHGIFYASSAAGALTNMWTTAPMYGVPTPMLVGTDANYYPDANARPNAGQFCISNETVNN